MTVGYLAYDPLRIDRLRSALHDAAVHLAAQRSHDPLSAEALRQTRAVHDSVAYHWLPLVQRVAACRALTAGGTRPGPVSPTASHLPNGPHAETTDTAFVDSVTEWAVLLEHVAQARQLALSRNESTAAVDARLDALAAVLDQHPERGRLLGELTVSAQPYAVAEMLIRLHVSPEQLGCLAAHLLLRWSQDPAVDIHAEVGQRLGALLMPVVARSPVAARTMIDALGPNLVPLVTNANDADLARAVLAAATAPGHASMVEAARILATLIDGYGTDDQNWNVHAPMVDWPALLAEMSLPWLPIFGPQADAVGWTPADGQRRLEVLVIGGGAPALSGGHPWLGPVLADLRRGDGTIDHHAVDTLTGTFVMLDDALRRGEIDADARDRALVAPLLALVDLLPKVVTLANPAARTAAREGVKRGTGVVSQQLKQWGVLPPDHAESTLRADRRWGSRVIQAQVLLFTTVAAQMIDDGELPASARDGLTFGDLPDGCGAAEVRRRIDRFIDQADGNGAQPATVARLWSLRNALLNDPTVSVVCR